MITPEANWTRTATRLFALSIATLIFTPAHLMAATAASGSASGADVDLVLVPLVGSGIPADIGPLPAGIAGSAPRATT